VTSVADAYFLGSLNDLARVIHERNVRLGFYGGAERPFDGMLMNVVTEASEAQEEWRDGRGFNEHHWSVKDTLSGEWFKVGVNGKLMLRNSTAWGYREAEPVGLPDHDPEWVELTPELLRNLPNMIGHFKPEGIPSELADIIIRVLDICGFHGIDIAHALADKMAYNETRQYRHGGKRS